jgi:hypothetical protein
MRKISPPPGFDPRTVQPVAIRYTDWATRPTVRRLMFHYLITTLAIKHRGLPSLDGGSRLYSVLDGLRTQGAGKLFSLVQGIEWRISNRPARKLIATPNKLSQFCRVIKSAGFTSVKNLDATAFCWVGNMVYLPVLDCFLCCVFCVLYYSVTLYYSVLLFFFCVLYCSLFLYCTVSACDVHVATPTEVFPCFFHSRKANTRV